ncbi:MAG: class I SAM-dependent DNA methyltransferase [Actinomycetota bacterium]|nr:class I SAM-dependent DNA methyltransferase [Actinomycetota bacterium]
MAANDALIVGEDWISEHYFTTDAGKESFHAKVLERRKAWDADAEQSAAGSTRTRFVAQRGELETSFGRLQLDAVDGSQDGRNRESDGADLRALYDRLLELLGYRSGQYLCKDSGPMLWVSQPGVADRPLLAVLRGRACESLEELLDKNADTLLEPWFPGNDDNEFDSDNNDYDYDGTDGGEPGSRRRTASGDRVVSVARALSRILVDADAPPFALVLAGRWCLITDPQRWPEGRYLAVDLQLVCEQNDTRRGGGIDSAVACLEAASLLPAADGTRWWQTVLDESIKHTVGVSQNLREGVRLSIEIIANDVVVRRRAADLDPLPADRAQPLAVQSLRYLYRILFLLYAEASPELEVLPSGATEYELGYGLDRLRELVLVELQTERARAGTHLYSSLGRLFELVDRGHTPAGTVAGQSGDANAEPDSSAGRLPDGLHFSALRADLFAPAATWHIDAVGLSNQALLRVLRHLLLSKESRGRERGFISYVELGINQLGAVYEGLMSYTGFFAEDDLYEVAKNGDPSGGSWVVPVDRSGHLDPGDFVKVPNEQGEPQPVLHRRGSFVFRLAGRERQQSASYYTPEVLTRFTVSQALAELLDQDGEATPADDILAMSVCEPAMGSGAFAIEAVRQLATEYLARKQRELGATIDPDAYPQEWQKVKAHIALHQVYGVDLNATAVELAEVSLWLDTMVAGLQSPWFGLRLRRGNSLIGARRSVYPTAQVADGGYRRDVPADVPLSELAADLSAGQVGRSTGGRIHHFLLPADGWGSAVEVGKEVRELAPDAVTSLKSWRSAVRRRLDKRQVAALSALSDRVEQLWQTALRRLRIAEAESGRSIDLWGREPMPHNGSHQVAGAGAAVSREQIEESLADAEGAYRRLRLVMDAWCALWFWPLTETQVDPPTAAQWIDALTMIQGRAAAEKKSTITARGDTRSLAFTDWQQLGEAEYNDRLLHQAAPIDQVLAQHRWLHVCRQVAQRQGFFHWELDFATVFARGGFDLQVGNPPWVRPDVDIDSLLAEGDPWWQLAVKPSEADRQERFESTRRLDGTVELVLVATGDTIALREFVSATTMFPVLDGLRPDLYRVFMSQVWQHSSPTGISTLIHLESHFTDEKAVNLRRETYRRLRRHWQFINELTLFEIQHQKTFGVNVYASSRSPMFLQAASLYHPDTVERSMRHDGSGEEPGFKDPDGHWDLRPHRGRIQLIDQDGLQLWANILEPEGADTLSTKMLYLVNSAAAGAMAALSVNHRVQQLTLDFSTGWNEATDRRRGRFTLQWGSAGWENAILQGPNLFVATPLYKSPNPSMQNHLDWAATDFEALETDALPVTAYKPTGERAVYDAQYTHWGEHGEYPARSYYRVAWRRMAANTGERTLILAIIPPGAAHVHPVTSAGMPDGPNRALVAVAGTLSTLLSDFSIRSSPKGDIHGSTINRLAMAPLDHPLIDSLILRTLRLNCVTDAYAELWKDCWGNGFRDDGAILPTYAVGEIGPTWTRGTPLRRAADRRNALVELDALVALMLNVPIDDLCTVYRTQFAVLYGYDHREYTFDANGRQVPTPVLQAWRKAGGADAPTAQRQTDLVLNRDDLTAVHPGSGIDYSYRLPFGTLDREADLRAAYAEWQRRLTDASGSGAGADE